jgi:hypothetical protein
MAEPESSDRQCIQLKYMTKKHLTINGIKKTRMNKKRSHYTITRILKNERYSEINIFSSSIS